MQRRGIIDAVAQIAHDMASLLQRQNEALLLVGLDFGKNVHGAHTPVEGFITHLPQLWAGEDTGIRQSHLLADVGGDQMVVAGDDLQRHA